ncbi:MAG TPA: dienelactone hydrolase family protein [Gemmatimonadales bacterium]|nr:dienelactone hydrolase family protein [Gemmatimonadales bacterium]
MQEHQLSTSRSARYFTLGSPQDAADVWLVCHGYGQLASRFLERFRPIEAERRCIVAPEGLSRFYLTEHPAERRVGASWMTREDRLREIDDYVRYLDGVYAKVVPRNARVTALGFSQGTATVCRWAGRGSSRLDRLIVWGGEVPPDLDLKRLRVPSLTLVYGTRDELFTPKIIAATEERLRANQIGYELMPFEGGHEIDEATLRRLI